VSVEDQTERPSTPTAPDHPLVAGLPAHLTALRRLGTGGFGAVYVAFDRTRNAEVALKKLERVNPSSLYRFKQEFRAMADLRHPNLVQLHELFSVEETWCFTMELVRGMTFDAWVGGGRGPRGPETAMTTVSGNLTEDLRAEPTSMSATTPERVRAPNTIQFGVPATRVFVEERLRAALGGLVAGVLALHEAGVLHRDLKPSNVLVGPDGRVVILDFGLVATGVVHVHQSYDGPAGTPGYMSPEQAAGAPLTAASDFYALGVMLYEALTGQPPFAGSVGDVLRARATSLPRDPRAVTAGLPDDLAGLCMELLAIRPEERPTGAALARRLGLGPAPAAERPARGQALVGRRRELETLGTAAHDARTQPVFVHVHGPPGIGKSALVRHFLSTLSAPSQEAGARETVVLDGRCYQRESVPYKALDPIVDALGRYLKRLPHLEAAGLLPRDTRALLRLFPTLGQLELMATLPGRDAAPDPHELRRRAFGALRELLARLSDVRRVVIAIDDAQWGDADSAALLGDLFAPPDPPPVLLVLTYRTSFSGSGSGGSGTAGAPAGEIPAALRRSSPATVSRADVDLPLGPLAPDDAQALARALLGPDGAPSAPAVARESAGSPLFIGQLARELVAGRRSGNLSLQRMLANRVSAVSDDARIVLEVLACAASPQEESVLAAANGLGAARTRDALELLQKEHLVGVTGAVGGRLAEILHEELRAAAHASLAPERARAYHVGLAEHHERAGTGDPEALAEHFQAAGLPARAAPHAERAGDRALEALAFGHAARLYGLALEAAGDADRDRVEHKLADAFAAAGRGVEAAQHYLACAERRRGREGLDLRRQAAYQLLRAGRLAQGLETIRPVLEDTGIAMPRTPFRALLSVLGRRRLLKMRGLAFTERRAPDVSDDDLRRIDLCWSLANGLSGVDLVRSADFQTRNIALALEAGEPVRIAQAFSLHGILSALENQAGVARAAELATRAAELARRLEAPDAQAWAESLTGVIAWSESRFADTARILDASTTLFRERCRDKVREIGSLETWFILHAHFLMGHLDTVSARAAAIVAEARARGDRYTESTARAYIMPLVWLAIDRPADAREEARGAIALWGEAGWHHQHWAELRAQCIVDLYEGAGPRAAERLDETRRRMKESLVLRLRTPRLEHRTLDARALLDAAWAAKDPRPILKRVSALADDLDAEGNRFAAAYATGLRAGVAARATGGAPARAAFATAEKSFEALSMPMHSAAARRRQAELAGDTALVAASDAALGVLGVTSPERFARILVPRSL
jgi:serine/threonine protein kinase